MPKAGNILCFVAAELLLSCEVLLFMLSVQPGMGEILELICLLIQSYFWVSVWMKCLDCRQMSRTCEQITKPCKVRRDSMKRVNIWTVFNCGIDIDFNRILTSLVLIWCMCNWNDYFYSLLNYSWWLDLCTNAVCI